MSIVPEYILQTTIVRGIKRMRSDSALIDQLFRNLDQKSIQQIRSFIKNHAIDLSINYPRTTLKVPALVLLLKAEKERHAFLGDFLGMGNPDEFSYDGGVEEEFLTGAASVAPLSINPKIVFGPYTGLTSTENTLRIAQSEWVVDQFVSPEHTIRIIAGTGVGQIRKVTANARNVVMVSPPWIVFPDNTSVFTLTIQPAAEVLGEPASLYNRTNNFTQLEKRGGIYDLTYQLQVIGPNPELTIYLSIIMKSIFTQFRTFMEGQGIIDLRMSATDFAPRPEYQPDLTYMRAINMDFAFPFEIFEPQDGLARSFRLMLEGQDDGVIENTEPADGSISVPPTLIDTSWAMDAGGNVISQLSDVQRLYYGVADPPVAYDANFVQNTVGGQASALAAKRQRYINYNAGTGQKLYYAAPTRFGGTDENFVDVETNVEAGFIVAATIPITTQFGTENYNIWESESPGLGFTQIQIT